MPSHVILLPSDVRSRLGERRLLSLPPAGGGGSSGGSARKYLLECAHADNPEAGARLLELQQVAPTSPASWFVDQSIVSGAAAFGHQFTQFGGVEISLLGRHFTQFRRVQLCGFESGTTTTSSCA